MYIGPQSRHGFESRASSTGSPCDVRRQIGAKIERLAARPGLEGCVMKTHNGQGMYMYAVHYIYIYV